MAKFVLLYGEYHIDFNTKMVNRVNKWDLELFDSLKTKIAEIL